MVIQPGVSDRSDATLDQFLRVDRTESEEAFSNVSTAKKTVMLLEVDVPFVLLSNGSNECPDSLALEVYPTLLLIARKFWHKGSIKFLWSARLPRAVASTLLCRHKDSGAVSYCIYGSSNVCTALVHKISASIMAYHACFEGETACQRRFLTTVVKV